MMNTNQQGLPIVRNPTDNDSQNKTGRPSRHWLVSELKRISEINLNLLRQLDFHKDLARRLYEAKNQLAGEIATLSSSRVVGANENEAIHKKNKQLSQDIFLMKNILVKLNFELERYQDKLRKYENSHSKTQDNMFNNRRPNRNKDWINGEMTILAPLLLAYDDSLKEKDCLISDFRMDIEDLTGKIKELVKENLELRSKITNVELQGEVNYSDWACLRREVAVSVEQNQLLSRQSKLSNSKMSELKEVFQAKLNEVCNERDEAISKLSSTRTDFLLLKGRNLAQEEEYQRLKEETVERIPKTVHSSYIAECRRLLEELKFQHAEEKNVLLRTIENLEEKVLPYQSHSSSFIDELKKTEAKLVESEERRLKCERKRENMKERMNGLIKFSKELINEHEGFLNGVNSEIRFNANLSSRIDMIKQQLKGVELETLEQIKVLDENIQCQVKKVNQVTIEKNQELLDLRNELQLKDIEIKELKNTSKNKM